MDGATLIRHARRTAGMSQRELAERADTSAAAICLYESGRRIPRTDTLARVLAAAGATLALGAEQGAAIDLELNGKILVEVLDLAEQLPFGTTPDLQAPVFASLAT